MEIIQVVLPIFAIIGLGFLLRRRHVVTDEWVHVLNTFVYYISLPALIVSSFRQTVWSNSHLLGLLGFNVLGLIGFSVLLVLLLSFLRMERKLKAAIYLTALVGNTIYMGFPLVTGAVEQKQYSDAIVAGTAHFAIGLAFSILAVEFFVLRTKNVKTYILDFVRHPLIVSLAVGIALSFVRIPAIDGFVNKTLAMLGATASPVALFALGGFLHGKFHPRHAQLAALSVVLKLAIFPLLLAVAAALCGLDQPQTRVSGLMAAMPTAVTAFVISEKYGLDKEFVANCIILSTIISLISISIFLYVF